MSRLSTPEHPTPTLHPCTHSPTSLQLSTSSLPLHPDSHQCSHSPTPPRLSSPLPLHPDSRPCTHSTLTLHPCSHSPTPPRLSTPLHPDSPPLLPLSHSTPQPMTHVAQPVSVSLLSSSARITSRRGERGAPFVVGAGYSAVTPWLPCGYPVLYASRVSKIVQRVLSVQVSLLKRTNKSFLVRLVFILKLVMCISFDIVRTQAP